MSAPETGFTREEVRLALRNRHDPARGRPEFGGGRRALRRCSVSHTLVVKPGLIVHRDMADDAPPAGRQVATFSVFLSKSSGRKCPLMSEFSICSRLRPVSSGMRSRTKMNANTLNIA